ncbi:MAG: ATP synthase subunit I [Pseudomonadota bacterium]|nr:ATP synthase subunit I [Pseudomonadota bacterium]MEC8996433.1 ATP synthase subunit I [Pseudomonadota bacterium]MED5430106.1 ATP synthase subunit I [Pseudomonadota bacterium]
MLRVILYQIAISLVVALVFLSTGSVEIVSSFFGGSLSILNTMLLAKGVNDAAQAAKKQEKDKSAFLLFKSLFVRIAIILIGFYVGIVYLVLEALQILVAFALAQIGYVFYKTKYIY